MRQRMGWGRGKRAAGLLLPRSTNSEAYARERIARHRWESYCKEQDRSIQVIVFVPNHKFAMGRALFGETTRILEHDSF